MSNTTVGILIDRLTAADLLDDCVKVIIRDEEFNVLAEAHLPDGGIVFYRDYKVKSYTFNNNSVSEDDKLFIDIVSDSDIQNHNREEKECITTVNTIDELIERMTNEELERCRLGKDITGACGVIEDWYSRIKEDAYIAQHLHYRQKMHGALNGLFAAYYISSQEFNKLAAELTGI